MKLARVRHRRQRRNCGFSTGFSHFEHPTASPGNLDLQGARSDVHGGGRHPRPRRGRLRGSRDSAQIAKAAANFTWLPRAAASRQPRAPPHQPWAAPFSLSPPRVPLTLASAREAAPWPRPHGPGRRALAGGARDDIQRCATDQAFTAGETMQGRSRLSGILLAKIDTVESPLLPTPRSRWEVEPPDEAVGERCQRHTLAKGVAQQLLLVLGECRAGALHLDQDERSPRPRRQ